MAERGDRLGEAHYWSGDDDREFSDPPDDDGYCERCGGEGWILTCVDDMCHGLGYCMHGDGMEMCACNVSCEPPSNAPSNWKWTPARAK